MSAKPSALPNATPKNHSRRHNRPLIQTIVLMPCPGMRGRITQEACIANQIIAERAANRCLSYDSAHLSDSDPKIPSLSTIEIDRLSACRRCGNCILPELLEEAITCLDKTVRAAFRHFESTTIRSKEQIMKDRLAKMRSYYEQNREKIAQQRRKKRQASKTQEKDTVIMTKKQGGQIGGCRLL